MQKHFFAKITAVLFLISIFSSIGLAQKRKQDERVRTVTIPISIVGKEERSQRQMEEFLQVGELLVKEAGEEKVILSIRSVSNTPLALAILIQDDLTGEANLKLDEIRSFIRQLPKGSRVMVAYLRGGTIQVRQKFTEDLDRAARSLRIISGSATSAPSSPYYGVEEALKRFDALPTGRRAILLVSDGLDVSRGVDSSSPALSIDLDRAILRAQRNSTAVYSFYSPTYLTNNGNPMLSLNGQGSLERLANETGGRAYFQGTIAPISFDPFFRDLNLSLTRQFALTYLSTNLKKGYYKIQVTSTNPDVKISHPKGYYYR